jgi:hypothetical protein
MPPVLPENMWWQKNILTIFKNDLTKWLAHYFIRLKSEAGSQRLRQGKYSYKNIFTALLFIL